MEIEEMKALWSEMSDQLEQQKKLTNEIILTMTQERYSNKFRTISKYENVGAIACIALAVYISINFHMLDTWFLKAGGIANIIFLVTQPILVLSALSRIKRLNILDKNYKETLLSYTKAKTNLLRIQQIGIAGGFLIIFTIPVFVKIMTNKDFLKINHSLWSYSIMGLSIVLAVLVSIWGYRHYTRITNSAQSVIEELE